MNDFLDSFLNGMIEKSRNLYQNEAATLLVKGPPLATVLVSDHRPVARQQHRITLAADGIAKQQLPAGAYTVTVHAPGYEPKRTYVELASGEGRAISAELLKATQKAYALNDILSKYGIQPGAPVPELRVEPGQYHLLQANATHPAFHQLTLTTIADVKRVLGHPDTHFAAAQPRYGNVITATRATPISENPTPDQRAAMREFVYGNSSTVAQWEGELNDWIKINPVVIGVWIFGDVEVFNGSVLEIGSQGLLCNTLKVHTTGTVVVSGNGAVVVEMNTYQEVWDPPSGGGGGGDGGGGGWPPHPGPHRQA
jgi:hypothetical protein